MAAESFLNLPRRGFSSESAPSSTTDSEATKIALPNYQRVQSLILPVSGIATPLMTLDCSPFLGLQVPALDLCTLAISGCVSTQSDTGSAVPMLNATGLGILSFPSTTGNFFLGASVLGDLTGCTHIRIGTSAPQNSGARTFTLLQRTSL